ncbi:MAG: MFS transporter, partial [Clostridiales bacterium]|nr:MFS transporter [Clostridiales bacterium]
ASIAAVPVSNISKRFPRRRVLIVGMLVMIAAFALAGTQTHLSALMFISFILAGGGYSVVLVNLYPYMMELSHPSALGKNTGIFNSTMTVAMVLTPIASGKLQDVLGYWILFPYCLAALIITVILLFFIRDKKKKPQNTVSENTNNATDTNDNVSVEAEKESK